MLDYQYALLNVSFDNSYENAIYFKTRTEQESFFGVTDLFSVAPKINFNFGTLSQSFLYLRAPQNIPFKNLSYNYCIIKDNTTTHEFDYLYFFIRSAKYDSGQMIKYELELDVIQTFFLDLTIQPCFIKRRHYKEFETYTTSTGQLYARFLKCNETDNSCLLANENLNIAKYIKNIIPLSLYQTENNLVNYNKRYFNTKWIYIYGKEGAYKAGSSTLNCIPTQYKVDGKTILQPYVVFCAPLDGLQLWINDGLTNYQISSEAIFDFMKQNSALIESIKISLLPPFNYNKLGNYSYSTSTPERITFNGAIGDISYTNGQRLVTGENEGIILFNQITMFSNDSTERNLSEFPINLNRPTGSTILPFSSFPADEIKQNANNYKYKIKSTAENSSIVRFSVGGSSYDYSLLKYRGRKVINNNFLYREIYEPNVTSGYIYPSGDGNRPDAMGGIYKQDNNFSGFLFNIDMTILFAQDLKQIFMANNKNFYALRDLGITRDAISNVMGTMSSFNNGNVIGGIVGLGATAANIYTTIAHSNLTLDNLSSAPDAIKGNSNPFLNLNVNFGTVQYLEGVECEMQKLADVYNRVGYVYNLVDNIYNCLSTKKYYNYIEAEPEAITHTKSISNEAIEKIKSIFRNGIRFFNGINVDLSLQNYDTALDG